MSWLDPRVWGGFIVALAIGIGLGELHQASVNRAEKAAQERAAQVLVDDANRAIAEAAKIAQHQNDLIREDYEKRLADSSHLIGRLRDQYARARSVPACPSATGGGDDADSGAGNVPSEDADAFARLMKDTAQSLAAGKTAQAYIRNLNKVPS